MTNKEYKVLRLGEIIDGIAKTANMSDPTSFIIAMQLVYDYVFEVLPDEEKEFIQVFSDSEEYYEILEDIKKHSAIIVMKKEDLEDFKNDKI